MKAEIHASPLQIVPAGRARNRLILRVLVVAALLVAGLWLRTLQPLNLTAAVGWPWTSTTIVTLYFADGASLFPVSRRMPLDAELPRATIEALLVGPPAASRLENPLPPGVALRSIGVDEGIARIDLSGPSQALRDSPAAVTAIVATMTRLPGVRAVALSVEGASLTQSATLAPLLYYPSDLGLVALPTAVTDPRAALDAYMEGPPSPELTGLPSDARLLGYDFDPAEGLLALRFAYTPAVRALALERPDLMRFLLLGLIATLTEFPEVQAVQLDFGGQTRLGLGECSDLLRTPQPRPALLNDERLLDW